MKYLFSILIGLLFLTSCKKEEANFTPGSFITVKEIKTLSKAECIQLVDSADIQSFANYDVKLIEVVYASEYEGKSITTSGMLFMPVGKDTIDFVTYCHGTVVPLKLLGMDEDTPSLYAGQNAGFTEIKNVGLAWASAGYTVFMPDYIGYNRTRDKEHPYVYYPELFKSIHDGNLAVKHYFSTLTNYYDNNLFLTGWSQGGAASLASQRYYESQYPDEFHIKASLNLSGPYSFQRFVKSVFDNKDEYNDKINIYSWAMYSLNKFSEMKRPNDRFWSYPVYDQVTAFNPPEKIASHIFNNYFYKQMVNGTDTQVNEILKRNSTISGWLPVAPVYLFHGDADDYVPYFNTEDCYNGLTAEGATINLTTYHGDNHYSVFSRYLIDAKNQMDLLK